MNICNIDKITQYIDIFVNKNNNQIILIAIDGHCTSGKTTLSKYLSEKYDCNIFHMDDFFLRPEQRTEERMKEIGGNVDYERFYEEIIIPLRSGKEFSYKPYDCHNKNFKKAISVIPKKLNIIEGSYSMHPRLSSNYDFKIFLNITEDLQRKRILNRCKDLHHNFFNLWIPLENQYFTEYKIKEKCDIIIDYLKI